MSKRNSNVIVPPLQSGDKLNRLEFERRYHADPTNRKFELIEGVVYMASPVTHQFHGNPHFDLIGWLFLYRMMTPGIHGGDNSSLKLDLDNEPQPDAFLYILPNHGGRVRLDSDGYIVGGPEFVAEVAASSASLDANSKKRVYEANGVQEYLLWRVYDDEIDWFTLQGGTYQKLTTVDGILRSAALPGLWLDPDALIGADLLRLREVVEQGLATPDHAAFVAQLNQAAQGAQP